MKIIVEQAERVCRMILMAQSRAEVLVVISGYPLRKSSRKRSAGASRFDSEGSPDFSLRKFLKRRFIHAPDAGKNLMPVQKKKTVTRENVGSMPMSMFCCAANMDERVPAMIDARVRKSMLWQICVYSSRSMCNLLVRPVKELFKLTSPLQ